MSIKWKTYLVFLACFLAFLVATFFMVSRIMVEDIKSRTLQSVSQQTASYVKLLEDQFDTMTTVYNSIFLDTGILNELQKPREQINYQNILQKFDLILMANDYKIFSIYLYDEKNEKLLSTEDYASYHYSGEWTRTARGLSRPKLVLMRTIGNLDLEIVSYTGWIRKDFLDNRLGFISVNMMSYSLNEIFNRAPVYNGSIRMILDEKGKIVISQPAEIPGGFSASEAENEMSYITLENETFLAVSGTTQPYGWRYLELIPEQEVFRSVRRLLAFFSLLLGVFAGLMLVVSYAVFSYVTRPITEIARMVEGYRSNRTYKIRHKFNRKDEIGYLYRSLEDMMARIDYLIDEVYEADLFRKETQLRMYREGIDPHFVYNVLDSIVWTLKFGNVSRSVAVLQDFSAYLRGTLRSQKHHVTICQMMNQVAAYASLASFLKDNPVSCEINYPEHWKERRVLSVLLEPIVENTFKHAFPKRGGKIIVTGREENNALLFSVSDDGVGIPPDRLEWLKNHITSFSIKEDTNNFGLASVHQRIILAYGAQYGLTIESSVGNGTCITVKIPDCLPEQLNENCDKN